MVVEFGIRVRFDSLKSFVSDLCVFFQWEKNK